MDNDEHHHHRRSIRLPGWDYAAPGAYFVTLVTQGRALLFGDIVGGEMVLTECGQIATEEWQRTAQVRPTVDLDGFVVMPNHIHGILWIAGDQVEETPGGGGAPGPAPGSLGAILAQYKSVVSKRINRLPGREGTVVWQRNYYERIVRNARELDAVRRYIRDNPGNWAADIENLARR